MSICVSGTGLVTIDGFQQTKLSRIFVNALYSANGLLTLLKAVILYKKSNQIEIFLLKMDEISFFSALDERVNN